MSEQKHPYPEQSPAIAALNIVGQKWTLPIVAHLLEHGATRFVELQRGLTIYDTADGRPPMSGGKIVGAAELAAARISGISTEQLRTRTAQMVTDGLLTKQRYREVPPRVDYDVTDCAKDLAPILELLAQWHAEHKDCR